MYEAYDGLPFGVIVLDNTNLQIQYINKKAMNDFNIVKEYLHRHIDDIKELNIINEDIRKCYENNLLKTFNKVKVRDRYFDVIINNNENVLEIFTYETTEYINNEIKIKEDNEKFLGISTEIKTKYDIIKRIRKIEKKYLMNLKNIVNNVSEGIVVLDKNKNFDFCNKSALKITGLTLDEIKNTKEISNNIEMINYRKYGAKFDKVFNYFVCNVKEANDMIVKVKKPNNEDKYININCNYIMNKQDTLVYIVISLKDITKIKSNEIMIKNQNTELERMTKMKDEFYNMISHELRTPLTIICSSLQLANDIYKDEITLNIEKILSRVNQNCSRLLKLINNTLDISKAEAGFLKLNYSQFDIVYVTESIISSVNLYAKSQGINLIFDTNVEECHVILDKDKYEKIILNLLSNAIKFTPNGKNIWIILDVHKDKIGIKVKDEGVGIPQDKIDNIFDRFSQINNSLCRSVQGTGLGLTLVKKFIDIMHGQVFVKSHLEKGTEFNIIFSGNILRNIECATDEEYGGCMNNNISDKVNIEFSDI